MYKFRLVKLFFVAGLVMVLGATAAYAGQAVGDDGLVYGYYNVREASNFMVVKEESTAPSCVIPLPSGKQVVTYNPVETPLLSCDPAEARPIAVGSVAKGGDVLEVRVEVGPFEDPVDVSFGYFSATFDAADIYFLNTFNEVTSLQEELGETSDLLASAGNGKIPKPKKNFKKLVAWKDSVTGVNETLLGPIDLKDVPPGLYVLVLNVTRVSPAENNFDRFYRWVTYFVVPGTAQ